MAVALLIYVSECFISFAGLKYQLGCCFVFFVCCHVSSVLETFCGYACTISNLWVFTLSSFLVYQSIINPRRRTQIENVSSRGVQIGPLIWDLVRARIVLARFWIASVNIAVFLTLTMGLINVLYKTYDPSNHCCNHHVWYLMRIHKHDLILVYCTP